MIYRKSPIQPTRLLLRVVAIAGAGALVNMAACGGEVAGNDWHGLVENPDGSDVCSADHVCGSAPSNCYDDAGDFTCGVADAGGGFVDDGGLIDNPCVDDAGNPTCGLIANPDAGGGFVTDAGEHDE